MLIAVDIGNSNIVIAVHDDEKWVESFRIYSDQKKTSDEYFVVLESLLTHAGIHKQDINRAVISSVVPNLTRSVQKNIIRLFDVQPLMVDRFVKTGLKGETIPVELGSDLLCNLAQAHHMYPHSPVMVVDFGTALTFSTVDSDGSVLGASIAPGLVTAVNALFGNTAQLPQVELRVPEKVIGRNSQDAIRSGIMFGYAGMVTSLIERSEQELGSELFVIATGGLSTTIAPLIGRINKVSPMHTLEGLRLIAKLN
ncbi:MAG: type III pantothenate kinase [Spirochaetia bacterium]|nr:type III pantothenate kinase [Spirochaetia bacterium]